MADEEWITPTEAARRVVALEYVATMTRQRIYQLADTDPAWPAPRAEWRNVGNYKLIPWGPVEEYFKTRDVRSGPKGWNRAAADS
jgi:hypothetical protein